LVVALSISKDNTAIVDGAGSQADVTGRVEQLRKEIEASDSDWDREKLSERLAKLSGGVAVIQAGAATEVEMKERKHRIEDAIAATKAAVDRKSTRLNSSHVKISYAVFC